METENRKLILRAIEQILDRDWPNEIKAERIFKDIIEQSLSKQKDEYESLYFADKSMEH